jgi:hypothetical protein
VAACGEVLQQHPHGRGGHRHLSALPTLAHNVQLPPEVLLPEVANASIQQLAGAQAGESREGHHEPVSGLAGAIRVGQGAQQGLVGRGESARLEGAGATSLPSTRLRLTAIQGLLSR